MQVNEFVSSYRINHYDNSQAKDYNYSVTQSSIRSAEGSQLVVSMSGRT